MYGAHPVLDMQAALNGDGHVTMTDDANLNALHDLQTDSTPRVLAFLVSGALLLLFLFKIAGFRFSFGVGAGGG